MGTKLHRDLTRATNMAREESDGCSSCARRAVVDHLCAMGYDAAQCVSKWKPTQRMLGGEILITRMSAINVGDSVVKTEHLVEIHSTSVIRAILMWKDTPFYQVITIRFSSPLIQQRLEVIKGCHFELKQTYKIINFFSFFFFNVF